MAEMRSAFDLAMEKAEKLGEASDEELRKWKYAPDGERLAARHLRGECNLITELGKYDDRMKGYMAGGAQEVLLRNIDLPRNDYAKRNNKVAMEAIKTLKSDKVKVENVYSKIRRIFNHYGQEGEQQRGQAYEALKRDFQLKLQQAVQQQLGVATGIKIDAEGQPQFQEEWRRVLAQLDSQYYKLLDEYKQEILSIP